MLTLTEAAAQLGLTASTLRVQIRNGKLRARKVGRDWTVSEREVARYAMENRRLMKSHTHRWTLMGGTIGIRDSICECGAVLREST